jgi:hypothetical protein
MSDGKKHIYTIDWSAQLGIFGAINNQFQIGYFNREYRINSINWEFRMRYDAMPMANIPIEENTVMEMSLALQSLPAGIPISSGYINPVPALSVQGNGTYLILYKPAKKNFEDFYLSNVLLLSMALVNRDLLNVIRSYSSVTVETEDI